MGNEGGPGPVGGTGNDTGDAESASPERAGTGESDGTDQPKTSTCATCWQPIPPGRVRCPRCVTPDGACGDEPEPWSYDRVVLAVVPADGARSARASAVTAFARGRTVASGADGSHGEVTLRAAFEAPLSAELAEGWPDLPDAAKVASATGQSLFEAAAARCAAAEPTGPTMYCEDGATVVDGDDVETLAAVIDAADVEYWVVPGVVTRDSMPEEPDAFGSPLYCGDCGAVTEHDASDPGADAPDRGTWACRVCGAQRDGPD